MLPFSGFFVNAINFVVSLGVITLLFALMFKFLPDAEIAWGDVWLGALVTAVLFVIGKFAIGFYLGRSDVGSTFGAAGSMALLLIWIYYSAQILYFGAEFTQVYANTYGSKIKPNENAVKITEEARAQQGMAHKETVEQAARGGQAAPAGSAAPAQSVGAAPATSIPVNAHVVRPRSHHLLPPPERRRSQRAGTIVSAAVLTGVLALVASFAQIIHDVRDTEDTGRGA
jgi:hypothetical protein